MFCVCERTQHGEIQSSIQCHACCPPDTLFAKLWWNFPFVKSRLQLLLQVMTTLAGVQSAQIGHLWHLPVALILKHQQVFSTHFGVSLSRGLDDTGSKQLTNLNFIKLLIGEKSQKPYSKIGIFQTDGSDYIAINIWLYSQHIACNPKIAHGV